MDDLERQEWERLEDAAEHADQALRDHQQSGARVGYRGGEPLGTADMSPTGSREWWARHDELKQAAERTREAADRYWEYHRPR